MQSQASFSLGFQYEKDNRESAGQVDCVGLRNGEVHDLC